MAAGQQKAPQSFVEALGDVHMAIAQAKLAPDADLQFTNQLEMVVIARMKHNEQPQPGGAQPPGQAGAGGGAPPGPPGGGPPAGPPPGGAPPPQGGPEPHPNIPQMDPDQLRRTVAQTTGQ